MTLPTVHVRVCVSVCVSPPVTQGVSCQTQNSDGSFCLNTGVNGWARRIVQIPWLLLWPQAARHQVKIESVS